MGMMRAREGASMKWTNLVSSSVCRHVWVLLDGSVRASSRMGVMAERGTTASPSRFVNLQIVQHMLLQFLIIDMISSDVKSLKSH